MTVTQIRELRPEHFELSFSDGSSLRVGISQIADFSLYSGRELTQSEFSDLQRSAGLSRAKERALRMIGARPMSCRELYDKLIEKSEPEVLAAEVVQWLIELHLIDDADYAAMLVRHYSAKGYGPRRIRDELYRHKLPRELWDEAMESLPCSDEALDRLLRSKMRGASPDDRSAVKKATDALLRRGFGWDEIRSAMNRYNISFEDYD